MRTLLLLLLALQMSATFGQSITFSLSEQIFPDAETFQVALGDLDNDGDPDAVFSNADLSIPSSVWFNDGTGFFTNTGQTLTPQGHGVALDDLNNDGFLDAFIVCVTKTSNNVSYYRPSKIYFNDGTGQLLDSGQNIGDSLLSANGIALVDIDADGDQDAQVFYYDVPTSSMYNKYFINDGSGIFSESSLTFPDDQAMTWNDLDLDGDMDIFIRADHQGYHVMLNQGNYQFLSVWEWNDTSVSCEQNSVILEDFDGDGDCDAFVVNRLQGNDLPAKVFFNDGFGQFTDSGQDPGNFNGWYWLTSGDIDSDGDTDIFISAFLQPNQIWVNNGNGQFTDSGLRLGGNAPHRGMALGDLDGDNDPDAFVANFGPGSNEVWLNETTLSMNEITNPEDNLLYQNAPNPFHSTTTIGFNLSKPGHVILEIYNVIGQEIACLVNGYLQPGFHTLEWNRQSMPGGVYPYRLSYEGRSLTKRLFIAE